MKRAEKLFRLLAQGLGGAAASVAMVSVLVSATDDVTVYNPMVWADSWWFLALLLAAMAILRGDWRATLGMLAGALGRGAAVGLAILAFFMLLTWLMELITGPIVDAQLEAYWSAYELP